MKIASSISYNPIVRNNSAKLTPENLSEHLSRKTFESNAAGDLVSTLVMAVNTQTGEIREVSGKRPDLDPLKPEENIYLQVIYPKRTHHPWGRMLRFIDSDFLSSMARAVLRATIDCANRPLLRIE